MLKCYQFVTTDNSSFDNSKDAGIEDIGDIDSNDIDKGYIDNSKGDYSISHAGCTLYNNDDPGSNNRLKLVQRCTRIK